MPANAKELIILKGYAVTGVTSAAQQEIMTKGYGPGALLPSVPDPDPVSAFRTTVLGTQYDTRLDN